MPSQTPNSKSARSSALQQELSSTTKRLLPTEVMAAAAVTFRRNASAERLRITIYSKSDADQRLELGLFDDCGDELLADDGRGATRVYADVKMQPFWATPECPVVGRIVAALDTPVIYRGSTYLRVPETLRERATQTGLWVQPFNGSFRDAEIDASHVEPPDNYFILRRRSGMCLGKLPKHMEYAFLLTQSQITKRVEQVHDLLKTTSSREEISEVLSKVAFKLYAGADTPLLAKSLESFGNEIERYLSALKKYARRQDHRNRRTHYGLASKKRLVCDEFPTEVPHNCCPARKKVETEAYDRELRIVNAYLREYASDHNRRELLQRRLLEGEPLKQVAEELDIPYEAAKAYCRRAKIFLGIVIPGKRKS